MNIKLATIIWRSVVAWLSLAQQTLVASNFQHSLNKCLFHLADAERGRPLAHQSSRLRPKLFAAMFVLSPAYSRRCFLFHFESRSIRCDLKTRHAASCALNQVSVHHASDSWKRSTKNITRKRIQASELCMIK